MMFSPRGTLVCPVLIAFSWQVARGQQSSPASPPKQAASVTRLGVFPAATQLSPVPSDKGSNPAREGSA